MKSENPNCVIVESGDLTYPDSSSRPTGKLETIADAFKYMGYTAVGVGPIDVRLGENYYKVLSERRIPVVHIDAAAQDGAQPYLIKEVDGVKVGIMSFGAVAPEHKDDFSLFKQRYRLFMEARAKCDLLILLDQGNIATDDWLERNTGRFGSPDIVLGGGTRIGLAQPKMIGQTMVVPTSTQGTYVGLVDVQIVGTQKKMTFSRTLLDKSIQDDQEVAKMVEDYNSKQRVAFTPSQTAANPGFAVQPYYNHQTCMACHPAEYDHWKQTRHSSALVTLVKHGKTLGECLPCHSDMYKRTRRIVVSTDQVGGVECIACHANVLPHAADFKKKGDTGAIRAQCAECHNDEHSPNFDAVAAYEIVKHVRKTTAAAN